MLMLMGVSLAFTRCAGMVTRPRGLWRVDEPGVATAAVPARIVDVVVGILRSFPPSGRLREDPTDAFGLVGRLPPRRRVHERGAPATAARSLT